MRTIFPKILAKLDFSVTMCKTDVAYSALKSFSNFLLTQFLKFGKFEEKTSFLE